MNKHQTRDRFRITCETEDAQQLGPIVAELARLGLRNVNYDLITDVLRYKKNTRGKSRSKKSGGQRYAVSSRALALQFAKKHKGKFTLAQIRELFEADGRPKQNANPLCSALIKKGFAKRTGEGKYQLTAKALKNVEASQHQSNGAAEVH